VQAHARATENTTLSGRQLRLKIMGFARGLIEARRRSAARRRARRNQQLLDARHKRDNDENS
jgi:hypothetical protein